MLWVPHRITDALAWNMLGRFSDPCLKRVIAVSRSTGQTDGSRRPTPKNHYESMAVESKLDPEEIVLVDDVITTGSTIMGGVNRLAETFPKARIRAFAMMRVISDSERFTRVDDPCMGTITMSGERTSRCP